MKIVGRTVSTLASSLVALGITVSGGAAHKGATGVVKERMVAMKDMGAGMKKIGLMVTGRKPYDAHEVKDAAKMIRAHANKIPSLFPKGTGHKPSVAKAEIWTDFADFKANAQRLARLAHALQDGAENKMSMRGVKMMPQMMRNPEKMKMMPPRMIFAMMAKTCSACHETYRQEKN